MSETPTVDLADVLSVLRFLATLPHGRRQFVGMREAGLTIPAMYDALDRAPVGTTVLLTSFDNNLRPIYHRATRDADCWHCPALPPNYGISATTTPHFWRGAFCRLDTLRLPGEVPVKPEDVPTPAGEDR